jgi:hypothetical protein
MQIITEVLRVVALLVWHIIVSIQKCKSEYCLLEQDWNSRALVNQIFINIGFLVFKAMTTQSGPIRTREEKLILLVLYQLVMNIILVKLFFEGAYLGSDLKEYSIENWFLHLSFYILLWFGATVSFFIFALLGMLIFLIATICIIGRSHNRQYQLR